MRGYDAWVTREPPWMDYEPPVYRCSHCGSFLKAEAEGEREFMQIHMCDGKPKVIECKYGETDADEGILAIIGEEYRGKGYRLGYAPACGTKEGSHDLSYDGEIDPEKADEWEHEPHWYADPYGYTALALRTCGRCGHLNEEVLT